MRAVSRAPDRSSRRPTGRLDVVDLVVAVVFFFPLAYLVWQSIRLGGDFLSTLTSSQALRPLGNSLLIASSTAVACAVLGTVLAWLVMRTDVPLSRLWRVVLPLPLVIPSFVGATALLAAFGPGGLIGFVPRIDGFWGAFYVLTLLTYPLVYLPVAAQLSAVSPHLEEASRLLGASTLRTFFRVVVPQLRESILAGSLLVFLYGLSDFGAVSLMRFDTITRAIFSSRLFDRSRSLTLALLLALLALTVAWLERIAPRREVTSVRGSRPVEYPLGRWSPAGATMAALVVGIALVAPIAVFVSWVLRGSTTVGVGFSGLGDGLGFLTSPIVNSTIAAVIAGAVAALVLLPVAFGAARRRSRLSEVTTAAVTSTFALPGLVVALALVFWAVQAPSPLAFIYQSFPLLILAYVLHFGAQSLGATRAAITSVPTRFDEAARTLGASGRRRFVTVDLPLIVPGLMAGAGLVMLSTLKELPATLLLAPIGFDTLATRIWNAAEDGFFAEVGITSLVLIALSAVLTWALVLRREPIR